MTEKLDRSEEITTWEDVAYSNMIQNEAVLRLLVKKGIITKEEFIEESEKVHQAFQQQETQGQ